MRGFVGNDQDSKMGNIDVPTGCMNPSNRAHRHTRGENSAQLHRYPAQKSMYKSTPSSVILVSPYVRPSPTLARAQHQKFLHDDIADSIFPIEPVTSEGLLAGRLAHHPIMTTFELRRVLHLDCPWSPVREGSMDLFP